MNALIGYTGFVGSNLMRQADFQHTYNSQNYTEMTGKSFDTVVCAGISAVKWLANKNPIDDLSNINKLAETLKTVKANNFILISTIDVYPDTKEHNETFDCTSVDNHPYGKNRMYFENFCNNNFEKCTIIRLPGLFGQGLKKNVIYDLLNDNCLDMININSTIQYYDLSSLWQNISCVISNNIRLINFFNEPISTSEIINSFFAGKEVGLNAVPAVHYDLRTKYSHIWNNDDNKYMFNKKTVLDQMKKFIEGYHV